MTWITPLEASMSGWTTRAPSAITVSPVASISTVEPYTVSDESCWPCRSDDITLPGTTW